MTGRNTPKPSYVATLDDAGWRNATLSERMLHVLRSQDKVREFPKGSNAGPMVTLYLKTAGILTPSPWCAALIFWALLESGADRKKLPRFPASTFHWHAWAVETGRLMPKARRGYLGVQNNPLRGGHIWVCLSDGNPHKTLEGNTNNDGSREGYGVFELQRSREGMGKYKRHGFIFLGDDLFAR